jgi:hypothetical protein
VMYDIDEDGSIKPYRAHYVILWIIPCWIVCIACIGGLIWYLWR